MKFDEEMFWQEGEFAGNELGLVASTSTLPIPPTDICSF